MSDTAEAVVAHGSVASRFAAVREAFVSNFARYDELGAAFAVSHQGELVVDIWGGVSDEASGRAWERETLQVIYSGTKGLVGLCLLILADRKQIDLDAPVCRYWPEFGAEGKQQVRVIDLASHRACLPGFATTVTEDELVDDRRMAALLAAQPLDPDPRAPDVYHPLTYGWLCGEVIRRIDGRSVGAFFADEVARPLGLRAWIGLPASLESQVSTLRYGPTWGGLGWGAQEFAADPLLNRVWNNPPLLPPGYVPSNRPDWHRAEIPGAGAIATARSIARFYDCLANGGELDGVRLISPQTLQRGRAAVVVRREPLLDEPTTIGVGFELQTNAGIFGPPTDAFGYGGAGGSIHCAWPSLGIGISYAMNSMRDDPVDLRAKTLLTAVHQAIYV